MTLKIGKEVKGTIFNIQRYCIHDGPGIRTTVFLKGCPLRCVWCQNPESQSIKPQLFYNSDTCTGCGRCLKVCPKNSIEMQNGKSRTKRDICDGCGKCVEVCPNEARNLMGKEVTAEYVFREVQKDAVFYYRSEGGMTLSGGEPLLQPDFSASILSLCKEAGIHTALDTSGYAKWDVIHEVLRYVDLVLFDFKHLNSDSHKRWTGVPNELILQNAIKIHKELKIPLFARIPVIPSCNNSQENMEATAKFIATQLDKSVKVFLLPYHKLGEIKYERLEIAETPFSVNPPSDEDMTKIKEIFESFDLNVQIGG